MTRQAGKETVYKLVDDFEKKDKSPEEIEAVKICDPACGSGSFLLGAFQYLMEYHREWYAKANQTAQENINKEASSPVNYATACCTI